MTLVGHRDILKGGVRQEVEVDHAGHDFGPDTPQVAGELEYYARVSANYRFL